MRKILLLLVMAFSIAILFGCKGKEDIAGVKSIRKEDIFKQKEEQYFVYFHRPGCGDCEIAEKKVKEYVANLKKKECKGKMKIYSVILYTEEEKPGEEVYIYRAYQGEDGHGRRGDFYVIGVTDWQDLYIASTSSLITISTIGDVKMATAVAHGYASVTESLEEELRNCYLK